MRLLLTALLSAHVVTAQELSPSVSVTGHFDSAFRQYAFASASLGPELPPVVRSIVAHFRRDETLEGVKAARALPSASASELALGIATLRDHFFTLPDDGTALRPAVFALMAELRAHVATLPRNDGGAPARELMWMEYSLDRGNKDAHSRRMAEFLETYDGTPADYHHIISQVDSEYGYDASRMRQRLRELAKQHDRTEYGAHALYLLAFRVAHDAVTRPPQPDPTGRFVEVLSIVDELQSGRFPKCEWVDKAPSLVLEFQMFEPAFAPGNIARMAEGYKRFILSQLARGAPVPNMGSLMSYRIGQLKNEGENSLPLIERVIVDLGKSVADPDYARSARAAFYLGVLNDNSLTEFPITPARAAAAARESLEQLVNSGSPQTRADAFADLASMDFYLGRYREARGGYLEFVRSFPSSDWAWVAALRAAEALEALGDVKGAAAEYEAAAARFKEPSSGAALALVAAADTRDASGDFAAATANYKAALALWGDTAGRIMIYTHQADDARRVPKPERFNNLTKEVLEARVERLTGAATPEGALLYQGRRALDEEKPRDAVSPLQRLIDRFPRSREAAEAPRLMRRARFEIALAAGTSRSRATELAALARDTSDDIGRAARLAEAALLLERGHTTRAETMTGTTLAEWHATQGAPAAPVTPFVRDASAIRAVLLSDAGRGVLGARWNAFDWPVTSQPYSLVNRDLVIKTPDGKESIREGVFAAPAGMRIIFVSADDRRNLRAILDGIGGTATQEPSAVMETPNQPVGLSVSIAAMWGKFFDVRPGHWGGWALTTYPHVSKIEFDREDHALAHVTVGYSGGVVEFKKNSGVWIAKRMVSVWIS
jgi:tetratricopeptide (TPR) repeat protein